MAYDFHSDKKRYFGFQHEHSRDYILPLVKPFMPHQKQWTVMEVGSAEAGVLKAFTDKGHKSVGVEISAGRVELAKQFMAEELEAGLIRFYQQDIHEVDAEQFKDKFDLIIMKDVIEHVYGQQKMLERLYTFLKPNGILFIGMPPWCMPFGGHQQLLTNKYLNRLPYFHLLPRPLYRKLMVASKEDEKIIDGLMEVHDTRISINRFKRISRAANLQIIKEQLYFINPNYKYKFGLKPRKQNRIIAQIPYLRDFTSTTAYFLLKKI